MNFVQCVVVFIHTDRNRNVYKMLFSVWEKRVTRPWTSPLAGVPVCVRVRPPYQCLLISWITSGGTRAHPCGGVQRCVWATFANSLRGQSISIGKAYLALIYDIPEAPGPQPTRTKSESNKNERIPLRWLRICVLCVCGGIENIAG